eukprot:TRINITY_DN2249_c0_g1_i1.p1 TRINITY_DN2249_c0_g1~~TRINITY_DN2249_c0_g1_i1.p1  ORF type:complete len:185 (-),score=41.63 TRINITY_DN2249_c0_g1_i1:47-601(-)
MLAVSRIPLRTNSKRPQLNKTHSPVGFFSSNPNLANESRSLVQSYQAGKLANPTPEQYEVLFNSFAFSNNLEAAQKLNEEMKNAGVSPSTEARCNLMHLLFTSGSKEESEKVYFDTLSELGSKVDSRIYDLRIFQHLTEGNVEGAYEIATRMKNNGLEMTNAAYFAVRSMQKIVEDNTKGANPV